MDLHQKAPFLLRPVYFEFARTSLKNKKQKDIKYRGCVKSKVTMWKYNNITIIQQHLRS